eukprot:TRINITY_DN89477_c0_g1_i1.p1 TRINITY_DN89477_c0_g1~~TRINITY_DN89477_c0_g1_i1.p1  ORF type:complete len:189 (-),score=86.71 TRINITY_DN89477_c0_g1_i1:49-615(-)
MLIALGRVSMFDDMWREYERWSKVFHRPAMTRAVFNFVCTAARRSRTQAADERVWSMCSSMTRAKLCSPSVLNLRNVMQYCVESALQERDDEEARNGSSTRVAIEHMLSTFEMVSREMIHPWGAPVLGALLDTLSEFVRMSRRRSVTGKDDACLEAVASAVTKVRALRLSSPDVARSAYEQHLRSIVK